MTFSPFFLFFSDPRESTDSVGLIRSVTDSLTESRLVLRRLDPPAPRPVSGVRSADAPRNGVLGLSCVPPAGGGMLFKSTLFVDELASPKVTVLPVW